MRSQNKGVSGCRKRSERMVDYLACRWWLVVNPNGKGGEGWLAGLWIEGGLQPKKIKRVAASFIFSCTTSIK